MEAADLEPLLRQTARAAQDRCGPRCRLEIVCAAELPALLPRISAGTETEKALEGAITAALFNGCAEGAADRAHAKKGQQP